MKQALIILTVFLLSSCGQSDGPCDGGGGCGGNYYNYARKNLGLLNLNDSSKVWMNEDTVNQIKYVNNNGHTTYIKFYNRTTSTAMQPFKYGDTTYSRPPCCSSITDDFYDYGTVYSEQTNYNGIDLPYNFSLIRTSVINTPISVFDSTKKFTGYDVFSIKFNDYTFQLPFNNPSAKFYNFYDSIQLNGALFYKIYKVYNDPITMDPTFITISGAYYSLSNGIIGFYLSNGETWVKK